MPRLVTAVEGRHFVAGTLKLFREHATVAINLDAVDELDVGRAAPRRHQPIGLGAAVFVGEDHGVSKLPAARCRHDFVPHQDRQIREAADRVRPRVKNRRHRLRDVLVASRREHDDDRHVDRDVAGALRTQRRVAVDGQLVPACRDRAERHAILG